MSMLIAIYGLAFNPRSIEPQLAVLHDVLPPQVFTLIAQWMHHLVLEPHASLGLGIGISTLITLWSAALGTRALLAALHRTHEGSRARRGWLLHAIAIMLTLGAIVAVISAIGLLELLPFAITLLGLGEFQRGLFRIAARVLLIVAASVSIGILYRIAASPGSRTARAIVPGMLLATLLWLLDSAILGFYVQHVARFGITYGPVVAVIGLMLWFFLTFQAVLTGAEFNTQLDRLIASRVR